MGGETQTLERGVALYHAKEYKKSLDQLLSFPPDQAAGNMTFAYYIGLCYMRLKKYEEALTYLELVVTSGGATAQVRQCRLLLAVIYNQTKRDRLADFELHKLIDSGYKTAEVYAALAFNCWEQKKINESISYYEMALKKDKDCLTAKNGLGYVLASVGRDLSTAFKLCKEAVKVQPESAAFVDSLGWVYFRMGMLKQAREHLERARQLHPNHEEIEAHLDELTQKENEVV
jgi:tetratricopeptide (TPR) repeat protein